MDERVLALEREVHTCEVNLALLPPLDTDAQAIMYRAELDERLALAADRLTKLKGLLAIDRH